MWLIRMAGWISASTLTLIFFGLRWLEWFFWGCDFYAAISILSLLLRAGVNANNRIALWIEGHSPRMLQQMGMLMSRTLAVRFIFWIALIVIGYQFRDVQAYQELVQRPHVRWEVIRVYEMPHMQGQAYYLADLNSGEVYKDVIVCEPPGWYVGLIITGAAYYDRGGCISFRGPKSYLETDTPKGATQ